MNNKDNDQEEELIAIPFVTEDGETINMYVLEETTLQGIHYILVTDSLSEDDEEAIVTIMKEEAKEEKDKKAANNRTYDFEEYTMYHLVEDETELNAVAKVFAELMDDVEFEI